MSRNSNQETDAHDDSTSGEPYKAVRSGVDNYSKPLNNDSEPPNLVEKGTFIVLTLTLIAAGYAGYEAGRLGDLTQTAMDDARKLSTQQQLDTQRALSATEKAATAAAESANAAKTFAVAATTQANATKDANRLNRDIFFAAQRPWVFPEITTGGPVTFTDNKDAQIRLSYTFKNIGHLPATNIVLAIEVYPMDEKRIFNSIPDQKRLCKRANSQATKDILQGHPIFPGQQTEPLITIGNAPHEQYMKAWPNSKRITFRIVGCIDYTFSSDSRIHGQTGFSYDLTRRIEGSPVPYGIDPNGSPVQPDNLVLAPDFFHGNYLK